MDWNQDFVPVAMDPHRVIVVFVLVDSRCKLNIDLFCNARGNHALLLVSDLKVAGLWGQNMQSLRCWRVIYQSKFHRVRLICLEASEFNYIW